MLILANKTNYRKGRPGGIDFIVNHYTAGKGDTAVANCKYFQGANRGASAHDFVDENEVVHSVPYEDTAGHSGVDYSNGTAAYHDKCFNNNSIGIEMCSDYVDGTYVITQATQDRTIELVKGLMQTYNIPVSNVIRHYDVCGKICPAPFVKHPEQWTNFKNSLTNTHTTPQVNSFPYKVKVTADSLNIRTGASTSFKVVGSINDNGIYTIVAEQNGWGKLKSGAGWIHLGYTKRV